MADEHRFTDLLERYLADRITPEERLELMQMVNSSAYDAVLQDKIGSALLHDGDEIQLQPGRARDIIHNLLSPASQPTSTGEQLPAEAVVVPWYRKRWMGWAVACVLALVGSLVLRSNKKEIDQPVAAGSREQHRSKADALFIHEVNTSGTERRIPLQDGSLVILADHSEISYRRLFTDKRDISLVGKAYFKVAKNKWKPFTVNSGKISTTALGTEFSVFSSDEAGLMIVRLYEGKVVVSALDKEDQRMKKDFYLLPGQEFEYNMQAMAKVRGFRVNKQAGARQANEKSFTDDPFISEANDGSWYMFNNQSLDHVLNDLSALYSKKIVYDKAAVQQRYFTGKYSKEKSLEAILERIAKLNDLEMVKTDTAFVLKK
ncbi:MAG: FecR family protein [Williamsia sp.]|nr:FecR family protein [Williamsia sp.]